MEKKPVFVFFFIIIIEVIVAQEQRFAQYFGTGYNTIINADRVNVLSYPSLSGDLLFQVNKNARVLIIGVSKEQSFIDNHNGNWLKIMVNENHGYRAGWVFGKYVDCLNDIVPSEIKILELPPKEEGYGQRLIGSYQVNGIEKIITFYPHKEEHQNFYTFAFDINNSDFHYTNMPGSYVWYPDTNELKHMSYIGTDAESAWVIFTDDFKYIIEDFGTGPAPRGLGVCRVNDEKIIYSGLYYLDIKLHEYTIEVIYVYNEMNIENKWLDNEILNYGENFKKDNPEPPEMVQYSRETWLGLDLIIICELNLDTGVRKIIRGQYIYTQ